MNRHLQHAFRHLEGEVSVEGDDTEQIVYDSLETMPKVLNGHVVVPGWVPDRYVFEQGVVYNNGLFEKNNVMYRNNDEWLSIDTMIYQDEGITVDFQYEREIGEPETIDVDSIEVLFYENSDEGSIYAAWVNNDANYCLAGAVTMKELVRIIESMNKIE